MVRSSAAEPIAATTGSVMLRVLRVVATLSVLMIVVQGMTAGQILSRHRGAEALHFDGAFVVHALTGLTALFALLLARRDRGPWWPTVLAVVVFLVGFVQAALGEAGVLAVHVPLAMVLLVGASAVMVWSLRRTQN